MLTRLATKGETLEIQMHLNSKNCCWANAFEIDKVLTVWAVSSTKIWMKCKLTFGNCTTKLCWWTGGCRGGLQKFNVLICHLTNPVTRCSAANGINSIWIQSQEIAFAWPWVTGGVMNHFNYHSLSPDGNCICSNGLARNPGTLCNIIVSAIVDPIVLFRNRCYNDDLQLGLSIKSFI